MPSVSRLASSPALAHLRRAGEARPAPRPAPKAQPAAPARPAAPAPAVDATAAVRSFLATYDAAAIAGRALRPVDLDKKLTGSNVKFRAEDEQGNSYTFKPFKPWHTGFEQEQFALALRARAGEPYLPVVPQRLTLPTGRTLEGYVKPRLRGTDDLEGAPKSWSKPQRAQLLADAAWAEFLGNYDLKLDQYKTFEVEGVKGKVLLNADWDCALTDYLREPQPLDRYKALKGGLTAAGVVPAAPPAQSLLYEAYVRGKVELDFAPMFDAVSRIEKLSEAEIRAALAPLCARRFEGGQAWGRFETPEDLVQAVLGRQKTLRGELGDLKAALDEERAYLASRKDKFLPSWREVKTWARDKWMHLGNAFVESPLLGVLNRINQKKEARRLGIEAPGT